MQGKFLPTSVIEVVTPAQVGVVHLLRELFFWVSQDQTPSPIPPPPLVSYSNSFANSIEFLLRCESPKSKNKTYYPRRIKNPLRNSCMKLKVINYTIEYSFNKCLVPTRRNEKQISQVEKRAEIKILIGK